MGMSRGCSLPRRHPGVAFMTVGLSCNRHTSAERPPCRRSTLVDMQQPTWETRITMEWGPREVVVVVAGAFGGPAVGRYSALITEAVASRPDRLVVDLCQCPSIDAAAIVLLLQVHRRLVCADGQLTLRGPVPRVRRMLSLAQVDHVLDVQPRAAEVVRDGVVSESTR